METVKVKRDCPRGYKIINKSDFDPSIHELYESAEKTEKRAYKKRGEA
jgi:hypothetical protein